MRPASGRRMLPRAYQSYRIHSLDGFPVLYKITEQQVLAGAGLDAYVVCNQNEMHLKYC